MLTIAKLHGESVAYYESTVDQNSAQNASGVGPDSYYSEDGTKPARPGLPRVLARKASVFRRHLVLKLTPKFAAIRCEIGSIKHSRRAVRSWGARQNRPVFQGSI